MAPIQVAVYLYTNADILDFTGPTEIYSHGPFDGPAPFKITSFAHHQRIETHTGAMTYIPNALFKDIEPKIETFDILVIPGAGPDTIKELIASDDGKQLSALLKKFANSKPREEVGKRILQSVCTGSLLLAASGILAGRNATTHHMFFNMLKEIADGAAGGDSKIKVQKTRWVDGGLNDAGVRIINAGGVSSGIDTSLYVVEHLLGKEAADWTAKISEFERRSTGWAE